MAQKLLFCCQLVGKHHFPAPLNALKVSN